VTIRPRAEGALDTPSNRERDREYNNAHNDIWQQLLEANLTVFGALAAKASMAAGSVGATDACA
jgi:hypothetical protein